MTIHTTERVTVAAGFRITVTTTWAQTPTVSHQIGTRVDFDKE